MIGRTRCRIFAVYTIVCGTVVSLPATAAEPDFTRAKQVYELWCTPCHGPAGGPDGKRLPPGSQALNVRYKGQVPPVLEDRKDLPAVLTKTVVRQGMVAMPFFRKTELSDADLDAVAAYLARNTPGS